MAVDKATNIYVTGSSAASDQYPYDLDHSTVKYAASDAPPTNLFEWADWAQTFHLCVDVPASAAPQRGAGVSRSSPLGPSLSTSTAPSGTWITSRMRRGTAIRSSASTLSPFGVSRRSDRRLILRRFRRFEFLVDWPTS